MSTPNDGSDKQRAALWKTSRYQRSEDRMTCPPASIAYLEDLQLDPSQTVLLVGNVSQHGLGIYTTVAFEPGHILTVHLEPLKPTRQGIRYQVMHCTDQAIGDWYVGCKIADKALSQEEVDLCTAATAMAFHCDNVEEF